MLLATLSTMFIAQKRIIDFFFNKNIVCSKSQFIGYY